MNVLHGAQSEGPKNNNYLKRGKASSPGKVERTNLQSKQIHSFHRMEKTDVVPIYQQNFSSEGIRTYSRSSGMGLWKLETAMKTDINLLLS